MTPEMSPESNGAPDARAIPRHRGMATRNTTTPAVRSRPMLAGGARRPDAGGAGEAIMWSGVGVSCGGADPPRAGGPDSMPESATFNIRTSAQCGQGLHRSIGTNFSDSPARTANDPITDQIVVNHCAAVVAPERRATPIDDTAC